VDIEFEHLSAANLVDEFSL